MIERYTRPEMGSVWELQNKYQTWLDVEIAVCEAWAQRVIQETKAVWLGLMALEVCTEGLVCPI